MLKGRNNNNNNNYYYYYYYQQYYKRTGDSPYLKRNTFFSQTCWLNLPGFSSRQSIDASSTAYLMVVYQESNLSSSVEPARKEARKRVVQERRNDDKFKATVMCTYTNKIKQLRGKLYLDRATYIIFYLRLRRQKQSCANSSGLRSTCVRCMAMVIKMTVIANMATLKS